MLIKFTKCYRKDDLQCNVYNMQLLREMLTQLIVIMQNLLYM